mgnify:CR=1 FL=1
MLGSLADTALALGGFAIGTTEFVTMGLLPGMTEKRKGHVVNISSIGVLTNAPRAYAVRAPSRWCTRSRATIRAPRSP